MLKALALLVAIAAQDSVTDRATLVVREHGRVVGRETYVLRPIRLPDGRRGYRLDARSQRRNITASATVQLAADGLPVSFTFVKQPPGTDGPIRFRGTAGRGRFRIVRTSPDGDALREYPVRDGFVIADEALFALYTTLARQLAAGHSRFRALDLSQDECSSLDVVDRGVETTELRGAPARLRHIVVRFPGEEHHVWLTEQGQLAKIHLPARDIVAERERD